MVEAFFPKENITFKTKCPVSKKTLEQVDDELIFYESKLAYPIRDGIPIMLPDKARKITDE